MTRKTREAIAVAGLAAVYGVTENELVNRFIAIMRSFAMHKQGR